MTTIPGLDERQLRRSVRTLAVMVECALQPQRGPHSASTRRTAQGKKLARIVRLIEDAAADQRDATIRAARLQLCQSFADAFRELLIPNEIAPRPEIQPKTRHGRPMGRSVPGRVRVGLGPSDTIFVHDIEAAVWRSSRPRASRWR
jgi:hypothetical protein